MPVGSQQHLLHVKTMTGVFVVVVVVKKPLTDVWCSATGVHLLRADSIDLHV